MKPVSGALATWRGSVFWRVAAVLLGAQLLAVAVAVGLSASAAYDRALDLAAEGVRLRLDAVAEEVELRADWSAGGLHDLSRALLLDLATRFPDPLIVVDALGEPVLIAQPGGVIDTVAAGTSLPPDLVASLASGVIEFSKSDGWIAAPLFDDLAFLAGGIVIQPIDRSLNRELAPARDALVRAMFVSALVVLVVALLLAGAFTWRLVGPLREMTVQVEAIGRGEYDRRVGFSGGDELGRLADTINRMAGQVSASIDELQATDRMRRELVANVGHDLRTPLAAILGRVDESRRMLGEKRVEDATRQLEGARSQALYLSKLVDDLFELAVLDSPSPPLRKEPVPIAELVFDAVSPYRDRLARHRVSLSVQVTPGLPVVQADGVRLLRLLNNLLTNAEHHTPGGGTITLEARWEEEGPAVGGSVVLVVADSGSGLNPEDMPTLFERYYRGTDARTRLSEGTGLGLPICKAIAVAHGGDLTAANGEDGGAQFTLTLPV
jgi:signal transduction histidine kinase